MVLAPGTRAIMVRATIPQTTVTVITREENFVEKRTDSRLKPKVKKAEPKLPISYLSCFVIIPTSQFTPWRKTRAVGVEVPLND